MNSYYERLIERLHGHYYDYGEGYVKDSYQVGLDCELAALALTKLADENARLRDESANYQQVAETLQINGFEDFQAFFKAYEQMVQAGRDGRLVVLPCKVGDTVWFIKSNFSMAKIPIEAKHVSIRGIDCDGEVWYAAIMGYVERRFKGSDIGKTVFLSREEAEEALGGSENA